MSSSSPIDRGSLRRKSLREKSDSRLYPDLDDIRKELAMENDESSDEHIDTTNSPASEEKKTKRDHSPSRRPVKAGASDDPPASSDSGPRFRHSSYRETVVETEVTNPPPSPLRVFVDTFCGDDNLYSSIPQLPALLGVFLLTIIALLVFRSSWYATQGGRNDGTISTMTAYEKGLQELRSKQFTNQHSRLWTILRSAVKSVFLRYNSSGKKKETTVGERSPAVILFISDSSDEQTKETTQCLVKKVANLTSIAFGSGRGFNKNYLDVDLLDFEDIDEGSKYQLEKKLHDHLIRKDSPPVVVMRKLQLLSSETGSIVHVYCDNENAPFREVVYYLTAECTVNWKTGSEEQEESRAKDSVDEWDALAESCLRDSWLHGMNIDKVAPILARIANNVVFVRPESTTDC